MKTSWQPEVDRSKLIVHFYKNVIFEETLVQLTSDCNIHIERERHLFFNTSLTMSAASDSKNKSAQMPFAEKYRPRVLDDVKGHADVLQYLKRCLAMRTVPHLLFVGPPGVGKTTCATCFAREYLFADGGASTATAAARTSPATSKVETSWAPVTNSRLLVLNASLLRTPRAITDRIGAFLDRSDAVFGVRPTLRNTSSAVKSSLPSAPAHADNTTHGEEKGKRKLERAVWSTTRKSLLLQQSASWCATKSTA